MEYHKIAIISDLHGNLYMLNAFLNYVEKEEIEGIINLGDFISEGPYPEEVAEKVLEDKRFINICGYDEEKMRENDLQEEGIGSLVWAREKLNLRQLEKIKELPSIKSMEIGNIKVLMMHLNGFAEISQKIAHSNRKMIDGQYYDYVFCGGGHLQQLIHAKAPFFNTNIIEPGAMMKDEKDRGHFAVLEVKDNKCKVTFESILCKEVHKPSKNLEDKGYLIEEVQLKQDLHFHIENKGKNEELFKNEVIKNVLEMGFKKGQYISLGCWANEEDKIKEILFHLKCRKVKKCEASGQQWYIGKITPEIRKFVEDEVRNNKGKLKWFEIAFLESSYYTKPLCSIYAYGRECMINAMTTAELDHMEESLKKNNIGYEL